MKKTKIIILMLMAMLFAGVALCHAASPQERTVVVTGGGADRDIAMKHAIADAVGMVTGLNITTEEVVEFESEQRFGNAPDEQATDRHNGRFSVAVRGRVSSFTVLEEKREGGMYKVKLSVTVPVGDESGGKKTIAIAGITLGHGRLEKAFAEKLRQDLNRRLLESREFCLLDRRSDTARFVKDELDLSASHRAPASDAANLGRLHAAKYLIVLSVHTFEVERWRGERDPLTRKRQRFEDVRTHVSWEILGAASGIICASGAVEGTVEGIPITSSRDTSAVVRLARTISGKVHKQIVYQANNLK